VGCEARKAPAEGDVFFLDFSLYRTMVATFDHRSALLVSELTGFVAKKR
jgi:hypothetical protein